MGVKTAVAVGAAGVAAGLVARSLVKSKSENEGEGRHPEGWKAVTILGDPDAFAAGRYPDPIGRIESALELRVEASPGDKGYEVHARVREDADTATVFGDDDPEASLRRALRDAKQLLETGEILQATPRPHGHRPATPLGKVVDKAEEDAKGKGVL